MLHFVSFKFCKLKYILWCNVITFIVKKHKHCVVTILKLSQFFFFTHPVGNNSSLQNERTKPPVLKLNSIELAMSDSNASFAVSKDDTNKTNNTNCSTGSHLQGQFYGLERLFTCQSEMNVGNENSISICPFPTDLRFGTVPESINNDEEVDWLGK